MSSARNKYLYIQNLLFDNHIHHTIPIKDKDPIEKQSISNIPIEDNFTNPTDFLQDYKHIQTQAIQHSFKIIQVDHLTRR